MAKQLVLFISDYMNWVEINYSWLRHEEIPANILKEFRISHNELSTFEFEEEDEFTRIAAAYAIKGDKNFLDYIYFSPEILKAIDIELSKTLGDTTDTQVNKSHFDLIKLSAEKVVRLAHVLIAEGYKSRIYEDDLLKYIHRTISSGWSNKRHKIPPKILRGLNKLGLLISPDPSA